MEVKKEKCIFTWNYFFLHSFQYGGREKQSACGSGTQAGSDCNPIGGSVSPVDQSEHRLKMCVEIVVWGVGTSCTGNIFTEINPNIKT